MVVSRGLKLLRPMTSAVVPPWRIVASGSSLFARPGSRSFAYCARTSLKSALLKTEEPTIESVFVVTSELPVCCGALCGPPFSKFTPVKVWRLKRNER